MRLDIAIAIAQARAVLYPQKAMNREAEAVDLKQQEAVSAAIRAQRKADPVTTFRICRRTRIQ